MPSGDEYYNHSTFPANGALGLASAMRAELDKVETGFGKNVPLAGNGGKLVGVKADESGQEPVSSTGTGNVVRATDPTFVLTDTVINNTNTSEHGWAPKLPGNTTTFLRGDGTWAGQTAATMPVVARSSNTVIVSSDVNSLFNFTGTFTQTFSAVASLGAGFYIDLHNGGTGVITLDPNGAETIDTLATTPMYPGEVRRVYVNSGVTALESIVKKGFYFKAIAGLTYIQPSGYTFTDIDMVGAPGGAGSGRKGAAGSHRPGGAPGGTPSRIRRRFQITAGTSITVAIGAPGTSGIAQTVNDTDGNAGTNGGNSTFGTLATARGGIGGLGGTTGLSFNITTGSGSIGAGTSSNSSSGSFYAAGGNPAISSSSVLQINSIADEGGAGGQTNAGGNGIYGGGGATSNDTANGTVTTVGGSSLYGIPAGGHGGWATSVNTMPATAASAGKTGGWDLTGATGGTCGASPTAGANGAANAGTDLDMGNSGAGGGSTITAGVNGGNGGDGSFPAGAPGGGGACLNGSGNSGRGGVGQGGQCLIWGVPA